jgi:ribosomal protein S18 acetylase RimI-like enzyme
MGGNKIAGMISIIFEDTTNTRHIANLYGFYVTKDYRGKGVAATLLKSAISLIRKNKYAVKVKLGVNEKQKIAIRLYKKNGFVIVGKARRELKIGNRFFDELLMEKQL